MTRFARESISAVMISPWAVAWIPVAVAAVASMRAVASSMIASTTVRRPVTTSIVASAPVTWMSIGALRAPGGELEGVGASLSWACLVESSLDVRDADGEAVKVDAVAWLRASEIDRRHILAIFSGVLRRVTSCRGCRCQAWTSR